MKTQVKEREGGFSSSEKKKKDSSLQVLSAVRLLRQQSSDAPGQMSRKPRKEADGGRRKIRSTSSQLKAARERASPHFRGAIRLIRARGAEQAPG